MDRGSLINDLVRVCVAASVSACVAFCLAAALVPREPEPLLSASTHLPAQPSPNAHVYVF